MAKTLSQVSGVFASRYEACTWHGKVVGESEKAYKVDTGLKGRFAWVAKSQVDPETGLVSEWLAKRLYEDGKVQLFECTAFRTW